MTTLHLKKSIGRSPLRLGFSIAALAVACFALMPFSTADAARECDNRWPNVTDENDAPKARKIHIVGDPDGPHFTTTKPCVPEKVLLSGGVRVKFKVNGNGKLVPESADLQNFHGEGLLTHREYVANDSDVSITGKEITRGLLGSKFNVIVQVTAKSNPGDTFKLKWTVRYSWNPDRKNLTFFALFDGTKPQCEPEVRCKWE